MPFRNYRLDNGVEIIVENLPQSHVASIGCFVRTGARDERLDEWGLSHFLEHMAFKGTPTRTAFDVGREFDEIGSHSNAQTGDERTVYYGSVLAEYQNKLADVLFDLLRPSLKPEDFDTEKQVILEEIAMYADQPPFGADDLLREVFYGDHPLGRSILGTTESVSALTSDQMRDYFARRYRPENLVIAAAGKIDEEALLAQAKEFFGDWKPSGPTRDLSLPKPNFERRFLVKPQVKQEYVLTMSAGPAADDERRYAMRLAMQALGDDTGSRYYWEFVDSGLAEYAIATSYEFQGAGATMHYVCCSPEDAISITERMEELQRELMEGGVTEDELTRAKNKVASGILLSSEKTSSRMFSIGSNWLTRGVYQTPRETAERYHAVTVDDVNAALAAFPLLPSASVFAGPLEESDVSKAATT